MPRKNIVPKIRIRDLEEADRTLQHIERLHAQIEEIRRDAQERIDAVKFDALDRSAPLKTRIEELETGLRVYAAFHRDTLFRDRKSVRLTFGSFGWRKSTLVRPAPKWTWARVLEKVRDLGIERAIRIREDVDREELHRWSQDDLSRVGVRRVEKETFWYEVGQTPTGVEAAVL